MPLPDVSAPRIGGDPAVDFLNTVSWRRDPARQRDSLESYGHVLSWMSAVPLFDAGTATQLEGLAVDNPSAAASELTTIAKLRDETYRALLEGLRPLALEELLPAAHAGSRLEKDPGGAWRWIPAELSLAVPRHRLTLELGRLLTSDSIARFHRCEDDFCGWVFLDTSRQRNRRWCSAADCGNRNRVRAHYARRNADPAPSSAAPE